MKITKNAEKLMEIDNQIWDQLGARSGGDIKANKWLYMRTLIDRIEKIKVTSNDLHVLEDNNYHTLMEALIDLGKATY